MKLKIPNAQLTHAGVYVKNMEVMKAFYTKYLGLIVVDQGVLNGTELMFLSRSDNEHHQLVLAHVPSRVMDGATTLNQISFRMDSLRDLKTYYEMLLPHSLEGMEPRHHGNSWSFYFFDPEGNKIEIYAVTPWQVHQPWRAPLDLMEPEEKILADTQRYADALPGSVPLEMWREEMRQKLKG